MSDSDDKSRRAGDKSHDHDHSHDHEHEHDHDHGHEHVHSHPEEPSAAVAPEGDDAGSKALSDALRSSFEIVKVLMIAMAVIFCVSGVFTVKPQERAVIFRFGRPSGPSDQLLGPGLHWAFPRPIDEVRKIPVTEIQTVRSTVGWYAITPEAEAAGERPYDTPSLNPATEGYTLTGDGNILHVRATMRYLITEPIVYSFDFINASNIVQNVLNNGLLAASSRMPIEKGLDLIIMKEAVETEVKAQLSAMHLGISLQQLEVQVKAPLQVENAFKAVLEAQQTKDKTVNGAHGYANALISRAQGESNAVVNAGLVDRNTLLASIQSESGYLSDRLPEYNNNAQLFVQRRLAETMQRVLTNAQAKWYLHGEGNGAQQELRLLLSKEPEKPSTPDASGASGSK